MNSSPGIPVDLMSGECNHATPLAGNMKNLILNGRSLRVISLALTLSLTPLIGGCLQQSAVPAETTVSISRPVNTLEDLEDSTSQTANLDGIDDDTSLSDAPAKPIATEKPLPPGIKPTESLSSLLRLVQSGVDESVLLSFVSNNTGAFSLGAEEVIYLSDIGVPGAVVSAMLQHDHLLVQKAELATQPPPIAEPEPTPPVLPPETEPEPTVPAPDYVSTGPLVPEETPTDAGFYDALAPYGTWVDVEGSGRCWQPSVVTINSSWRPYCDRGHWVYTDCGWYWASDYTWGWAPFHYGRWFRHNRLGWCWSPDNVWGPSWVSWRYSNDYCGWAPLPPVARFRPGLGFDYHGHSVGFSFNFGLSASCYTFVPTRNFCDSRVSHHVVPYRQVKRFYDNTVAVNRIVGDRKRISNYGIPAERITAVTHARLRQIAVRGVRHPADQGTVAGQPEPRAGSGSSAGRRPISSELPRMPSTSNRQSNPEQKPGSIIISGAAQNPAASGWSNARRPDRPIRTGTDFPRIPAEQPRRSEPVTEVASNKPEIRQNTAERKEPRSTEGTQPARTLRQRRINSLVVRGATVNTPAAASTSLDRQPERMNPLPQSGHNSAASYQAQRSTFPNLPRSVEGRPRYERPEMDFRSAAVSSPQELPSRPVAPAASLAPSARTYNPPPINRSLDSFRQEAALSRAQQPSQFHSGGTTHHQPQMNASAPESSRSPLPQAIPPTPSANNHSSFEKRGR